MKSAILIINSGSSSIKFSLFVEEPNCLSLHWRGQIDGIGVRPQFQVKNSFNEGIEDQLWDQSDKLNHEFFMKFLIEWLRLNLNNIKVVSAGHRVVHGGVEFNKPIIINEGIIARLEKLIPLAPLHQGHNLSAIKALKKYFPELPQVACFDTSFHTTNPMVLKHFFIPRELEEKDGVLRYGFHGLSYEYIARSLREVDSTIANKKVIIAHLGSGSSMCAIDQGKSVSTSMGMTALDGLPMGTRPGCLDSGVVLYLMKEKRMSAEEIENLLYKKSGLLGLSGISNDMRQLENSSEPRAKETIEAFVWKICQMIGSLAAVVQGFDALVFTAGIGENSISLRKMVCQRLGWLGVKLDEIANQKVKSPCISTHDSRVKVFVLATNEELMIAEHVQEVLGSN